MEKTTISARQFYINKAIEIAKVEKKSLDEYSNRELAKIAESFASSKMLALREKLGEEDYKSALNSVCFSEDDEDSLPFEELEMNSFED